MIGSLTGTIIEKFPRQLLLEVSGIGYRIFVTQELFDKSRIGDEQKFFIHTAVREDAISLFGFEAKESILFFELLLTVTRVGPKLALDIMNTPLPKIKTAIVKKDLFFLSSISGVGKKTAERVVVELKDKVSAEDGFLDISATSSSEIHEDVIQALMKLGYQRNHIHDILKKADLEAKNEGEIIKYFLQNT